MTRIRTLWWMVSGSLWLVPSVIVFCAAFLAIGLIDLEGRIQTDLAAAWPRLFGAGADGARAMLSAIAGSMITVAGVVFSVTLVALTLTASQYSPRIIRTFMQDRPTQAVLGVFVGVFAYCLVVLRSIRGESTDYAFVPSLAVFGGMVLALIAIGFLVFFIHHLAVSIEASSILARLQEATSETIDDLFPPDVPAAQDIDEAGEREERSVAEWLPIHACTSGYIVSIDYERLSRLAEELQCVVKMHLGTGDFAIEGCVIAYRSLGADFPPKTRARIADCYAMERVRTIEQDALFGMQQIVDVALKALSPGINDQTTAVMCVDRLTQLMVRIADRRVRYTHQRIDGRLRLIRAAPDFDRMLRLAFDEVRLHAKDNRAVLSSLRWGLDQVRSATHEIARMASIARLAREVAAAIDAFNARTDDRLHESMDSRTAKRG